MPDGGLLGWATDALVKLDDEVPGVIARTLTAAPARKQAIFAALAGQEAKVGVFDEGEALFPQTSLAEVIRHGRANDILRHVFGDLPEGYAGMLERIGARPLDTPQLYLAIHQMLCRNDMRAADALRASGRITRRKLEVLSALDPRWHHANTLERIDTGAEALRFNAAVDFVKSVSSRISDETVAQSIAMMRPTSTLPRLLDRFIRRADRLPINPVPVGDNELRPLQTVRDYVVAGRKHRNCLPRKLSHIAAGRMAVAEFKEECLVEFRPLSSGGGWIKWLCHGPRNGPLPVAIDQAVDAKCDALGLLRLDDDVTDFGFRSFRQFTQELEWG